MLLRWITWATCSLALITIAILCIAIAYWLAIAPVDSKIPQIAPTPLPKPAFSQPQQAYDAIGAPAFFLEFTPLTSQLPDMRRYIDYHGKSTRPDAIASQTELHFSSVGQKFFASILPGERLYLTFDKNASAAQYNFSPNNAPTPLWFTAHAEGNQAILDVWALDEKGQRLEMPSGNLQVAIAERELGRSAANSSWELDGLRVDATLFVRQKARWFGTDKFLSEHGGEEFADQVGKQRIDFGEGENSYSVYLNTNDVLVWKDKRWQVVTPGEASRSLPLIVVKKIDERIMALELWDPDGRIKVTINLLKSAEAWNSQIIQQMFTYEGARTRRQFIFDINGERVFLSPHDWLLLSDKGWIKLEDPKAIDDYVNRRLIGTLFVFLGVERHEGKQILRGELYSPARSDMQEMELIVQPGSKPMAMTSASKVNDSRKNPAQGNLANKQTKNMPPSSSEEDSDDSIDFSDSMESEEEK